MSVFSRTLPNGIKLFVKEQRTAPVVAIQCWVGVGSMDESPLERGMSHFIEHMLFKGTKRRKVGEIATRVESCGGDINAYTTFDRTVFYLTLAAENAREGMDILVDAVLHSTFDAEEMAREKEVVLEEIKRSEDDPGSKTGRRIFELAFSGTEVGRPIIGSTESVSGFSRDDVVGFYKKWYQPKNLSFVVVGDIDGAEALAELTELLAKVSGNELPERSDFDWNFVTSPIVSLIKGDYTQPRLEVSYMAPPLESPDAPALDLAAFALGSGETSRLNHRLRDKDRVVTAISASTFTPRFGGLFEVSAYAEEKDYCQAVAAIGREMALITSSDPVTEGECIKARANVLSDRVFREETVDGQARSLGFGLTTPIGYMFDHVYETMLAQISPDGITQALTRWVNLKRTIIVGMLPKDSKITEAQVLAAYEQGCVSAGKVIVAKKAKHKKRAEPVTKIMRNVRPGLDVLYRQLPDAKTFSVVMASAGGLRAETDKQAGHFHAMASLVGRATVGRDYRALAHLIEGRGAAIEGFSGKDSFGVEMQCVAADAKFFMGLLGEVFLQPRFPEVVWTGAKREILAGIKAQFDSPANMAIRKFQEGIFAGHPYRVPLFGRKETVSGLTSAGLEKFFKQKRDQGRWLLTAVGPQDADDVQEWVRHDFAKFKGNRTGAGLKRKPILPTSGSEVMTKDREQTHIVYGFPGLAWGDKDRYALDILVNILGGNGGRLFLNLRDRDSLAYTVSPIASYGVEGGVLGSYIACAPSKTQAARESLRREMFALTEHAPSADELDRAKQYIVGNHAMDLQRGDSQTMTMVLMELYGLGWDDFLKYPDKIQKVTAKQVLAVARRLIREERSYTVQVGPKEK